MKSQPLKDESVVSVDLPISHMPHKTFKIAEWTAAIIQKLSINKELFEVGVPCQALTPGQSWRSGKIKITFEFEPDDPVPEESLNQFLTSQNSADRVAGVEETWPPK